MIERMGEGAPLRVLGRYALHEAIAAGGMATVHYGRLLGPVGFARTVAIKRLHERFAQDPEFTSMFLDEARLAARIRHPNVVPTLDVVALEGEIFLVMEYVQGESLARLYSLSRDFEKPIPIPTLATIIASALHGLHAAHEATKENGEPLGIIHRDVSPQNILVGADGVARVLDFGVAKAAGRAASTREGQLKGKLAYMAPEQLRGRDIGRTVDIYAAGIVLWEGLARRKLFAADSEAELFGLVLGGQIDPPSKYAPEVPPELDTIVLKALGATPAERFSTAREMARALEKVSPFVPASGIGEWVEALAGNALEARSLKIAQIEQSTVSGMMVLPPPKPRRGPPGDVHPSRYDDGSAVTNTSLANRSAHERPARDRARKRTVALFIGLAVLALTGIVVGAVSLSSRADRQPSASSSDVPSPALSASAAALASASAVPTATTASAEPAVTTVMSATVVRPVPPPTTPTAIVATARPTATGARLAGSGNCDPPYVVDAKGARRYKRDCLRE